ncbi:MAG: RHS repeat-associated core domain-containing protein, partial [Candidatus Sulfotelmatobacter sp.]
PLAHYTQRPGVDQPLAELRSGVSSYYQQDGLGSVTSLSSGAGALANTYTFDSFGRLTASTGTLTNPFQYAGREFDPETGLYYNRARYYDENIGRFINEDPARVGKDYYSYVSNNPTRWIDPSGLCKVEIRFWKLGPWWYHAYVVTTSPDGSQHYFRGGPSAGGPSSGSSGGLSSGASGSTSGSSSGSSGSSGSSNSSNSSSPGSSPNGGGNYDPWGSVAAQDGDYVPGTIDWDSGTPPTEVLQDDGSPCDCVNNKMKTYENSVNSSNIPYNPFSTNSNAFAFGAAGAAGFNSPAPPVWAPGSGTTLPIH